MYKRQDYLPHMVGLFVVGLILLPFFCKLFNVTELGYDRLFILALLLCSAYAFAFTRELKFSFSRFLGILFFLSYLSLRSYLKSAGSQNPKPFYIFLPGGLSIVIMALGGWFGVKVGRATGWTERFKKPEPTDLPLYGTNGKEQIGQGVTTKETAHPLEQSDTEAQEETQYEGFNDNSYQQFLTNTYEGLESGWYSRYNFKNVISDISLEDLTKAFDPCKRAVYFAFTKKPPERDEYLVCAENADVGLSYVLTNKYFYFFGLDDDIFATKYKHGKVALSNIKKCTYKEGWINNYATLTLRTGQELYLKGLQSTTPLELIDHITKNIRPDSIT